MLQLNIGIMGIVHSSSLPALCGLPLFSLLRDGHLRALLRAMSCAAKCHEEHWVHNLEFLDRDGRIGIVDVAVRSNAHGEISLGLVPSKEQIPGEYRFEEDENDINNEYEEDEEEQLEEYESGSSARDGSRNMIHVAAAPVPLTTFPPHVKVNGRLAGRRGGCDAATDGILPPTPTDSFGCLMPMQQEDSEHTVLADEFPYNGSNWKRTYSVAW